MYPLDHFNSLHVVNSLYAFFILLAVAPTYKSHVDVLASSVKELNQLEKRSQQSYLRLKYAGEINA